MLKQSTSNATIHSSSLLQSQNRLARYISQPSLDFEDEVVKKCSFCKQHLPLTSFVKATKSKWGYHVYCLECSRQISRKNYEKNPYAYGSAARLRRYGMTAHAFEEMLSAQHGKCYICSTIFDMLSKGRGTHKRPCVDHDHTTGKTRALLCTKCNSGLGAFTESIPHLSKAIDYLNEFNAK